MQKSSRMEEVFKRLDQKDLKAAIEIIKKKIIEKDGIFIEDLVISLNILTETSLDLVKEILPSLLSILNFSDDVIRYSMIVSLKKFVEVNMNLILPYAPEYLKSESPKNREGMLLLLKYVAEVKVELLSPYFDLLIEKLGDQQDFVRKKAVEVLIAAGKKNRTEIEAKTLSFIKTQNSVPAKEAADQLLKGIIDLAVLEKQDNERTQLDAQTKSLSEKAKELEKTENDLKKVELEIKERELQSQAEKDRLAQEIKESQQRIEEKELQLKLEKLKLQEEQKGLELKKMEEERERLKKEKELIEKQIDVARVKQELEQKRLEQEKSQIIAEEAERIQKKMKELSEKEKDDENYEEI